MVKVKKKRKGEKGSDGLLEGLLRFEIVVLLFALIGFYYFLSFSPIRMPKEPIATPSSALVPLAVIPGNDAPETEEVAMSVDEGEFSDLPAGSVGPVEEPDSEPPAGGVPVIPVGPVVGLDPSDNEPTEEKLEEDGQKPEVMPSEVSSSLPAEQVPSETVLTPEAVAVPTPVPTVSFPVKQVLVVGSYLFQADLQRFRTQLEELGFEVKTETINRLTSMYRVFFGPYTDQRKVQEMMAVVRDMGDQPFLQSWDSGVAVVIGSFHLKASVVAWENMYNAAGFDPVVRTESLMMPHTWLRLDGPRVVDDPETALARVQAAGFPQAHLKTISPTRSR